MNKELGHVAGDLEGFQCRLSLDKANIMVLKWSFSAVTQRHPFKILYLGGHFLKEKTAVIIYVFG